VIGEAPVGRGFRRRGAHPHASGQCADRRIVERAEAQGLTVVMNRRPAIEIPRLRLPPR